ncbi:MAG: hypothetical protein ACRCYU_01250 [Nocardioides sp.]
MITNMDMTNMDRAIAREVLLAYRQLRRAEINGAALRHATDRPIVARIRRARWRRLCYRPATARFDRALLAFEAHLAHHFPRRGPRDFIGACTAILNGADRSTRNRYA